MGKGVQQTAEKPHRWAGVLGHSRVTLAPAEVLTAPHDGMVQVGDRTLRSGRGEGNQRSGPREPGEALRGLGQGGGRSISRPSEAVPLQGSALSVLS